MPAHPAHPSALPLPPTELLAALSEANALVIAVDRAGCVTYLNSVALAFTGRRRLEEVLGQPLAACLPLHEGSVHEMAAAPRGQLLASVQLALTEGVAQRFAPHTVLRRAALKNPVVSAGAQRALPVAGSVTPWRDASGEVAGALLLLHDLCERERAERESAHVTRQESLAALAGRVAHDFNNMLTVVLGNLALAQRGLAPEQESQRLRLSETERGCQRACELTRDLLGFATQASVAAGAAASADKAGLVALGSLAADCVQRVQSETGLRCEQHWPSAGPGTLPKVRADEAALRRLLDELFLNAIHAVSLDQPESALQVCGDTVMLDSRSVLPLPPGDYVRLRLRDPGVGIAVQDWTRVFEPFFTTRPHARGLGLPAAWHLARAHGGYLTIDDSTPGFGTTIMLLLPAATSSSAPATGEAAPAAPLSSAEEAPEVSEEAPCAGRVLVMDDEESIRDLTSSVLGRFGYTVDGAQEGREAVEKYLAARDAGRPFDVVFLDLAVRRGGLDGKTTAERLRAVDPQARLIVLTGQVSDPALSRYRDFGFSGRVRKPFGVSELIRELESVLGK
ncbi:MAG: response regulator [Verrucomicrobia bacterium]|nr:response regulator [Verrucomicrobiota bacterium]